MSAYLGHAVVLTGRDAFVLARLIERDRVIAALDNVERADLWREIAESAIDAIERAGAAWADARRTSDLGSAELPEASEAAGSVEMETCSTAVAAELLGVSDRQVRNLIDAGSLPAAREGRAWRVDRAFVSDLAQRRSSVSGVVDGQRPAAAAPPGRPAGPRSEAA